MRAIGRAARGATRVYLTGGASAVLLGWRPATIDVDLKFAPERDELFRAIPELKLELGINVELASSGDFIPLPPGWEDRSPFIEQVGTTFFHPFDFYSQALAKVERGHAPDGSTSDRCSRQALWTPGARWASSRSSNRNSIGSPRSTPAPSALQPRRCSERIARCSTAPTGAAILPS